MDFQVDLFELLISINCDMYVSFFSGNANVFSQLFSSRPEKIEVHAYIDIYVCLCLWKCWCVHWRLRKRAYEYMFRHPDRIRISSGLLFFSYLEDILNSILLCNIFPISKHLQLEWVRLNYQLNCIYSNIFLLSFYMTNLRRWVHYFTKPLLLYIRDSMFLWIPEEN